MEKLELLSGRAHLRLLVGSLELSHIEFHHGHHGIHHSLVAEHEKGCHFVHGNVFSREWRFSAAERPREGQEAASRLHDARVRPSFVMIPSLSNPDDIPVHRVHETVLFVDAP